MSSTWLRGGDTATSRHTHHLLMADLSQVWLRLMSRLWSWCSPGPMSSMWWRWWWWWWTRTWSWLHGHGPQVQVDCGGPQQCHHQSHQQTMSRLQVSSITIHLLRVLCLTILRCVLYQDQCYFWWKDSVCFFKLDEDENSVSQRWQECFVVHVKIFFVCL